MSSMKEKTFHREHPDGNGEPENFPSGYRNEWQ
jgi:hypothetical protein